MTYVDDYVDVDLRSPDDLLETLLNLRHQTALEGARLYETWAPNIRRRTFRISAHNLAHYLAMRSRDWRRIQEALIPWGLSSLGRSESRVLANLDAVICALGAICRAPEDSLPPRPDMKSFFRGHRLLRHHEDTVFGSPVGNRWTRIMVTMPTHAAHDAKFLDQLLRAGMDAVRITCAHDKPSDWKAMIRHARKASAACGRPCRIFLDLSGPKIRTGKLIQPKEPPRLVAGDAFLLSKASAKVGDLPQITCALPEVIDQLQEASRVWIDDGKWCAQVESITPEGVLLRVTQTPPKGGRLAAEKGLNLPGLDLKIDPLTTKDLSDLDFALEHADGICFSFANRVEDVDQLLREIAARKPNGRMPIVILKIETERAVRALPQMLVRLASVCPTGVMIARGDLAVEIGFERLAEMQEEILWLCEAAHVPVVWATQVLERFVKKGTPSRSEMTDAAMAVRAECVMLNKGDYIVDAVGMLDRVLTQMQRHTSKKTPKMHALRSWADLTSG